MSNQSDDLPESLRDELPSIAKIIKYEPRGGGFDQLGEMARKALELPALPGTGDTVQEAIHTISAQAATARHDGYMRVLVFGPIGAAAALIAELPLLPVLGVVAAGVALTSWLDRPEPEPGKVPS